MPLKSPYRSIVASDSDRSNIPFGIIVRHMKKKIKEPQSPGIGGIGQMKIKTIETGVAKIRHLILVRQNVGLLCFASRKASMGAGMIMLNNVLMIIGG